MDYDPHLQSWETNTMVYLATTSHTEIRAASRAKLDTVGRTVAQVAELTANKNLTTLRLQSTNLLRQEEQRVTNLSPTCIHREWQGIPIRDAIPITPRDDIRFNPTAMQQGLHIWEPFGGSRCSGLVAAAEAGYPVGCYTHSDICENARNATRSFLPKAQTRYPGLIPTTAIRGFDTRLPNDISNITNDQLTALVKAEGPIDFIVAG